jgi:hypothetical protein
MQSIVGQKQNVSDKRKRHVNGGKRRMDATLRVYGVSAEHLIVIATNASKVSVVNDS